LFLFNQLPFRFDNDVRDVLQLFLKQNPSETIIMLYQQDEKGSDPVSQKLKDEMSKVGEDFWWDISGGCFKNATRNRKIPTLDQVRGKVVLLYDYKSEFINDNGFGWEVNTNTLSDMKVSQARKVLDVVR
jgi:hypothetical protein